MYLLGTYLICLLCGTIAQCYEKGRLHTIESFINLLQDVHRPRRGGLGRVKRAKVLRDHRHDGVRQRDGPRSPDHRQHGAEAQEALHPRLRHVD